MSPIESPIGPGAPSQEVQGTLEAPSRSARLGMGAERGLADTNRLEALSDGVYAIVTTLLVFEIRQPQAPPGHLAAELLAQWPVYFAYLAAFSFVGVTWLNHHYVFGRLAQTDLLLNWINLGILGTAALIPFPTGVLSAAFRQGDIADERTALLLYAIVSMLATAQWIPLFIHLRNKPSLLKADVPPDVFASQVTRPLTGLIGYVVGTLLGYLVSPLLAVIIFGTVIVFYATTSQGSRRLPQWRKRSRK